MAGYQIVPVVLVGRQVVDEAVVAEAVDDYCGVDVVLDVGQPLVCLCLMIEGSPRR